MSFGFGSNNNNNNTFGGFGSSNTGTGFGANNNASTGGSLFGGNTATAGTGFGGFGSNNNNNSSPFGGPKPAFGAATTTAGGGLFGNNNNTATSGGFGSTGGFGNPTNTGGFGGSTSGGLFGQNKPAATGFGSTSGSLFGGGSNTAAGGFGSTNTATNNPFSTTTNTNANTGFGASNNAGGFTFGASSAGTNNNSGTANPPFQAVTDKEPQSNITSAYQSITFQSPYQNKSFEELRTEDYAQGRRFGNSNGQAGGFGQSTGFGGFGASNTSTGGGLFGSNTATAGNTGFGNNAATNNTNTLGGFGATNTNTGGGLFGNKPAGGLFGAQSSATTTGGFGATAGSGGGLFGGGGNSFGNTNNTNTGGSLFGANNQQQQNKPAFGGFGATNTSTGFGNNANTGGGLFGNTNNANTGGGLFGQNNQQQQQQNNPFGATNTNTGGGLFGAQNKPATGGLFGNNTANAGGSLFGTQNNQQQTNPFGQSSNTGGGLFGAQNQNQNKTGGLFGNTTGGSLFGAQNNQNSSLFGGTQNNNAGGSLFGAQNKPAGTSLFGSNTASNTNTGGLSLFGNNQQNQQNNAGGSLFGNQNQNQQNTGGNSLFGGSLGQSQQPAQNQLHASLTGAPYGNEQLFSSLAAPSPPVGPLATPLSGAKSAPRKTPSLLASARVNTPVFSPRAGSLGRNGGYGFSYSTYGTPGSAFTSGSLTPGASSLLKPTGSLGSALTSRLNKSFSTSNLRGDSISSEGRSLLRPSAFSPEGTPGRYSNDIRKLKIDRSLRTDLFGPEPKAIETAKDSDSPGLRKKVSFESSAEKETTTQEASASNALVRTEDRDEDESPTSSRAGASKSQVHGKAPEMEQVSGAGALTTVPEDAEAPRTKATAEKSKKSEIGDYWTKPPLKDLKNMGRQQLKNVGNFTVGRDGVGRIEFGQVDLTNTPLEDICGSIVQLNPRSATVYQDDQDKPARGKALNVPSTIYLEHSWPRSQGGRKPVSVKSGKEYDKHIARLKRVAGTQFLNYDPETGIWSFKVEHFTTYGLDDDDDESVYVEDSRMEASSPLSNVLDREDLTLQSMGTGTGEVEDTFQFKLDRRSQLSLPGGFDSEVLMDVYDEPELEEAEEAPEPLMSGGLADEEMDDPFGSGGPVQVPSPGAIERYHSSMIEDDQDEQEIPGSFVEEPKQPRPILKPSTGFNAFDSPEKLATESWEEQLQRTMSPKKRDRQALKAMQQDLARVGGDDVSESPFKQSILGRSALDQSYLAQKSAQKTKSTGSKPDVVNGLGKSQAFRTAMDLMDSMYAQEKSGRKATAGAKGFEYPPNTKKLRLSATDDLSQNDRAWHDSMKPNFAPNGTLIHSVSGSAPKVSGELTTSLAPLIGQHEDVRFAKFVPAQDLRAPTLTAQLQSSPIDLSKGLPAANAPKDIFFGSLAADVDVSLAIGEHEKAVWQLCSILYDPFDIVCRKFTQGVPENQVEQLAPRMQMDAFREFWSELVAPLVQEQLKHARTPEEKVLLYLTKNDINAACETLAGARCLWLANLISQLPGTPQSRAVMKSQIEGWKSRHDWSEMSDSVRALYSILAGELCVVEGAKGSPENRVPEFNIAEKFSLTWRQSFALRLFYGGFKTYSEAIHSYLDDVDTGRERVDPTKIWSNGVETDDILMELLCHFADAREASELFNPLAVSGSALNSRLTWQLATLLNIKGNCDMPNDVLDQITLAFAAELENAESLVNAALVTLHIRDPQAREEALVALLNRHGDKISTPGEDTHGTFEELTKDIKIPSAPVWRAKTLYAKGGLHNPALQAEWLLRAGDVDAAHEVLCSDVGPQAVIEKDYDLLSTLLQHFDGLRVHGWEMGGGAFADFLTLVHSKPSERQDAEQDAAVKRLRRGLAGMEGEGLRKKSLEEKVAIIQMNRVVDEFDDGERDMEMAGLDEVVGLQRREVEMLGRFREAMGLVG